MAPSDTLNMITAPDDQQNGDPGSRKADNRSCIGEAAAEFIAPSTATTLGICRNESQCMTAVHEGTSRRPEAFDCPHNGEIRRWLISFL